ncbi:MAG: S1 family peptidase [Archangiaceae bacterium]|nr:S1 family peptidase [Archangiaceae bacterium]
MRHAWLGLVAALVGCERTASFEAPGQRQHEIVGGMPDDGGFPQTLGVAVFYGAATPTQYYTCTGVLIAPTIALTAAHCLDETLEADAGIRRVLVTARPVMTSSATGSDWLEVVRWRRTPEWTPQLAKVRDLGVLQLAQPIPATPAPPISRPLDVVDVGRPMEVVGYGRRVPTVSSSARQRTVVSLPLRGLTPEHIQLGEAGVAGVCAGDSGGPSFMTDRDGVRRVVGIHSWTFNDAGCTNGLDTRVDLYRDFIVDFVTDAGAQSCASDLVCVPGCQPIDQDCACASDGRCNPTCVNPRDDADCPLSCEADGFCSTLDCVTPDPDCHAELDSCTSDQECAWRTCATDTQRGERYCSRTCQQGCAEGTTCVGGACLIPYVPPISQPHITVEGPAVGCQVGGGAEVVLLALWAFTRRRCARSLRRPW